VAPCCPSRVRRAAGRVKVEAQPPVGLLCLQSRLSEEVGPAVYVTPLHYLARQVVAEAKMLGISITEN
jgi:hypothetical protein